MAQKLTGTYVAATKTIVLDWKLCGFRHQTDGAFKSDTFSTDHSPKNKFFLELRSGSNSVSADDSGVSVLLQTANHDNDSWLEFMAKIGDIERKVIASFSDKVTSCGFDSLLKRKELEQALDGGQDLSIIVSLRFLDDARDVVDSSNRTQDVAISKESLECLSEEEPGELIVGDDIQQTLLSSSSKPWQGEGQTATGETSDRTASTERPVAVPTTTVTSAIARPGNIKRSNFKPSVVSRQSARKSVSNSALKPEQYVDRCAISVTKIVTPSPTVQKTKLVRTKTATRDARSRASSATRKTITKRSTKRVKSTLNIPLPICPRTISNEYIKLFNSKARKPMEAPQSECVETTSNSEKLHPPNASSSSGSTSNTQHSTVNQLGNVATMDSSTTSKKKKVKKTVVEYVDDDVDDDKQVEDITITTPVIRTYSKFPNEPATHVGVPDTTVVSNEPDNVRTVGKVRRNGRKRTSSHRRDGTPTKVTHSQALPDPPNVRLFYR